MANKKGILYVMTTVLDGLIKVGRTGSDSFEQRMYNLEHTGYCNVTGLKRRFAIEVNGYIEKEEMFKKLFSRSRVADTELYSLDLQQVISLLSSFEGNIIYPKDETKEELFEQASEAVESSDLPDGEYYLSATVNTANGKEKVNGILKVENGILNLCKGSLIASVSKITVKGYNQARNEVSKENNVLLDDVKCDSVSMAAAIVCGSNQNGWDKWKDNKGNKIDIYRNHSDNE